MTYEEMLARARAERRDWSDDQLKADYKMWRTIEASGRMLDEGQQARYQATREAIAGRHLIVDHP